MIFPCLRGNFIELPLGSSANYSLHRGAIDAVVKPRCAGASRLRAMLGEHCRYPARSRTDSIDKVSEMRSEPEPESGGRE